MRFLHARAAYEEADFVILGCASEVGSRSKRKGSRFAPAAIRKFSQELRITKESFLLPTKAQVPKIHDIGDVSLNELSRKIASIALDGKTPLLFGGDHSLTIRALRGLKRAKKSLRLLYFDAHPDMIPNRGSYYGSVLYEILKEKLVSSAALIGMRAPEKEEIEEMNRAKNLISITARDLSEKGVRFALKKIRSLPGSEEYISIDVDVFDPSFAPAASVPSPMGLNPREVLSLCKGARVAGLDIMEFVPKYDIQNRTASLITFLVLEILSNF